MIRRIFNKQSPSTMGELTEIKAPPVSGKQLFFVHIPKTAGTSFRKAIETIQQIDKDYGAKACETSPLVKKYMYDEFDPYIFKQVKMKSPFALSGHVQVQKYADFFQLREIVTFLREPVSQIVSHYNHHVSHHDYKGSFDIFYKSMPFRNVQARHLNGFPLTLLGGVGLTEKYDESLSLISNVLELEIESLRKNQRIQVTQQLEDLPKHVVDKIVELNQQDIQLYKQAVELHQERMNLFVQQKPWTHIYASVNQNNILHGCAFFAKNDHPVSMQLRVNGEQQMIVKANSFCGLFPKFNFPRQRYVGFHLPLTKWIQSELTQVELEVCETGQIYNVVLPVNTHN